MAEVYEQSLSSNGQVAFAATAPQAQTFTPSEAHRITSVKVQMRRVGLPGVLTFVIRGTVSGKPSGPNLCSGTINANDFTMNDPGEWYEIDLGEGVELAAGIMYAIVCHVSEGDASNYVRWRWSTLNPYAGGTRCDFMGDGDTWAISPLRDLTFQELGEAVAIIQGFTFIGSYQHHATWKT